VKSLISIKVKPLGTCFGFLIAILLSTYSLAGEVIFSFDEQNIYIKEGNDIFSMPKIRFLIEFGEATIGKRVDLGENVSKFYSQQDSIVATNPKVNQEKLLTYDYGGLVYAIGSRYNFLLNKKYKLESVSAKLTPKDIQYTWAVQDNVASGVTVRRGIASAEGESDSVRFNGSKIHLKGTIVKTESLDVLAVKVGNSVYWFKSDLLENSKNIRTKIDLEISKEQILWIAKM